MLEETDDADYPGTHPGNQSQAHEESSSYDKTCKREGKSATSNCHSIRAERNHKMMISNDSIFNGHIYTFSIVLTRTIKWHCGTGQTTVLPQSIVVLDGGALVLLSCRLEPISCAKGHHCQNPAGEGEHYFSHPAECVRIF